MNRRRILYICLVFCFVSVQSFSQVPTILLLTPDSSFRQSSAMVQLQGNGVIGSNTFDNLFFHKAFFGGRLENDHLAELSSAMKDRNRAGLSITSGLDFYNFRDTIFNRPQWGIKVGISTNYYASLSFSKDLFDVVFRGNSNFAGDTASLGPLAADYQAYQKFGIGIFNKKSLSSTTLSLVAGQNYQSLILSQAGLYTSALGDSLAMTYTGDYLRSDTTKRGWANGSGVGVALDFEMNIPLQDHRGAISVAVHDLGFVAWNQLSEHFTFDSLTTWTGVRVNDVFQLATDTLDMPHLKDSLHYQVKKKSFFAPLPTSIHVRFSKFFSEKNYYEAGMSILTTRAAMPFIYASMNHFAGSHFIFSEKVSFGGFGKFGVGAEVQWMPAGSWLIRAGSNNLAGFVLDKAHSRDVYFTLSKFIK